MQANSEMLNLPGYQQYQSLIIEFIKQSISENRKNAIALLTGIAGVGKTRLATQVQVHLQERPKMKVLNVINLICSPNWNQTLQTLLSQGVQVVALDEFEMLHDQPKLEPILSFIHKHPNVIYILISNCPEKLKKEFWPKVTYQMQLPLPGKQQRIYILKSLCRNRSEFEQDIDYEEISEQTQKMTAADLTCLVREAQMIKLRQLIQQYPNKNVKFYEDMLEGQPKTRTSSFRKILAGKKSQLSLINSQS